MIFLRLSSNRLLYRKLKWRLMTISSKSSRSYAVAHFWKADRFYCLLARATSFMASTLRLWNLREIAELMRARESSLYLFIILEKSMNLKARPAFSISFMDL